MVKLGSALTVKKTVAVSLKGLEVPVIFTAYVPVGEELLATNVNMLVPIAGFGLNDAETPLGRPDAVKLTFPLNPFWPVIVIAVVLEEPCVMLKLDGDAPMVKYGPAFTVSSSVVVAEIPPEVPVIVIG